MIKKTVRFSFHMFSVLLCPGTFVQNFFIWLLILLVEFIFPFFFFVTFAIFSSFLILWALVLNCWKLSEEAVPNDKFFKNNLVRFWDVTKKFCYFLSEFLWRGLIIIYMRKNTPIFVVLLTTEQSASSLKYWFVSLVIQ